MTTKQWLLDVLEVKESQLRSGTDSEAQKMIDYLKITNFSAWKQIQLSNVEKARRLIELGHDEP